MNQKPPPWNTSAPPKTAFIREDECIGCTKCIPDCPTDAIVGAAKLMHTVMTDSCTGCELCVPTCPVDCIEMRDVAASPTQATQENWLSRFEKHNTRIERDKRENKDQYDQMLDSVDARKRYIEDILKRNKK